MFWKKSFRCLIFKLIFLLSSWEFVFLVLWKAEREMHTEETDRQMVSGLLPAALLPKCPQYPGLGRLKVGTHNILAGRHHPLTPRVFFSRKLDMEVESGLNADISYMAYRFPYSNLTTMPNAYSYYFWLF